MTAAVAVRQAHGGPTFVIGIRMRAGEGKGQGGHDVALCQRVVRCRGLSSTPATGGHSGELTRARPSGASGDHVDPLVMTVARMRRRPCISRRRAGRRTPWPQPSARGCRCSGPPSGPRAAPRSCAGRSRPTSPSCTHGRSPDGTWQLLRWILRSGKHIPHGVCGLPPRGPSGRAPGSAPSRWGHVGQHRSPRGGGRASGCGRCGRPDRGGDFHGLRDP